jgi:plastocyanin
MKRILLVALVLLLVACSSPEPALEVVKEDVPKVETPTAAVVVPKQIGTKTILIQGRAGFDPAELAVKVNQPLVWRNQDARTLGLTFQKDGSRMFFTSAILQEGEEWEHQFKEVGRYEYWTVAYGVKGVVVVE